LKITNILRVEELMGEAKRRTHQIEHNEKAKEALLTLQRDEGVVARTTIAVFEKNSN
jgi:hypothetical protein